MVLHREVADDNARVLRGLRARTEVELHEQVFKPLLAAKGAMHIEYLHGSAERGKDFRYVWRDIHGNFVLEVCQVKNAPITGDSGSSSNVTTVLSHHELPRLLMGN